MQFTQYGHQLEEYETHRDTKARALHWEQGLGKSKAAIDKACHLYSNKKIDGFMVVAPPGIERNWMTKELPAHLWDATNPDTLMTLYRSDKTGTKYHKADLKKAIEHKGFSILCISYDALKTNAGRDFARAFFKKRTVFQVLDESTRIKSSNRKCKTTRIAMACTKLAKYRMIMTGTPVSNGPFDVYHPIMYLDPQFWKRLEMSPYGTFKSYFGRFMNCERGDGKTFEKLLGYRNLKDLHKMLAPIASRKTKAECLDLPDKIYSRAYFGMNPQQEQAYRDMEDQNACDNSGKPLDFQKLLKAILDGELLDVTQANLAIVRILRLQQIACGFVPRDDGEPVAVLGKTSPRMELVAGLVADHTHGTNKTIVWSRFRLDIANIVERLKKDGFNVVEFHGGIDSDSRAANIEAFQDGDADVIVANKAMSQGYTLTACKTMLFVANTYSLEDRQQEEDRAHRIGLDDDLKLIDTCAQYGDGRGTIDDTIIESLQNKLLTANMITGDAPSTWTQ